MSDLAQAYFPRSTPRSASIQLHRWIELNTELKAELENLHFKPRQRALTPYNTRLYFDTWESQESKRNEAEQKYSAFFCHIKINLHFCIAPQI